MYIATHEFNAWIFCIGTAVDLLSMDLLPVNGTLSVKMIKICNISPETCIYAGFRVEFWTHIWFSVPKPEQVSKKRAVSKRKKPHAKHQSEKSRTPKSDRAGKKSQDVPDRTGKKSLEVPVVAGGGSQPGSLSGSQISLVKAALGSEGVGNDEGVYDEEMLYSVRFIFNSFFIVSQFYGSGCRVSQTNQLKLMKKGCQSKVERLNWCQFFFCSKTRCFASFSGIRK